MQFSVLLVGFVSALSVGTATAAKLDMRLTAPKEQKRSVIDSGACQRQSNGIIESWLQCNVGFDMCPDYGVSWTDCAADCCSVSTKKGRGCPGK
ncbi:hypothetical protein CkaCkLH20_09593 [Colletotrichum karsti]|uniref:Uncharacterized protein n=1 Tax=Colletotrichum karsti TaxID=1095194 RepID=A0A9P6HX40_9PEZI|nr:uncharacterized protein CkaCkLH20_09593 [Colletotrichum karsti]KAF9873083.1 hypothetical protein CkaCkLH20_09593 [Colletotrichum karsti]